MSIKIHQAIYAAKNSGADVTKIVQALVDNGNDDITVNNSTMGGDPDFGQVKSFCVSYTLADGQGPIFKGCQENGKLDLAL